MFRVKIVYDYVVAADISNTRIVNGDHRRIRLGLNTVELPKEDKIGLNSSKRVPT